MRAAPWLLLVALLGLVAHAEPEDAVDDAMQGVIAGPLGTWRTGSGDARADAEREIRKRSAFAIPYLLGAAESTADAAWRQRCLDLAYSLPDAPEDPNDPDRARRMETPSWEPLPVRLGPPGPEGPCDGLEAAHAWIRAERPAEAARVLLALATKQPDQMLAVLRVAARYDFHKKWRKHDEEDPRYVLDELEALAREPGPDARVELELASWARKDRDERLDAVVTRFPGTPEDLLAKERKIRWGELAVSERVAQLEALANAHPGTEAAREALDYVAFEYGCVNLTRAMPDPYDRFRAVCRVAARLQSHEFLGSEGALAAVKYVADFFIGSEDLQKADARAMLEAYRTFFRNHFLLDVVDGRGTTVNFYLPNKLGDLHAALGVPKAELAARVDAELDALEAALPDKAAIRYLRADRAAKQGEVEFARKSLAAIETGFPGTLYARKALAAQAGLAYATGDLESAEALYARYLKQHAGRGFAWLAALRIGHCRFLRGDVEAAIHAYDAIDAAVPGQPRALAVHRAVALAWCFERTAEVDRAIQAWREALSAWHPHAVERTATAQTGLPALAETPPVPDATISRADILQRVRWLEGPGMDPADLERFLQGSRLHDEGRIDDALRVWMALAADRPESPVAARARESASAVWVGRALDKVRGEQKDPDVPGALQDLDRAERVEARFGTVAAALVRAALHLRAKQDGGAQKVLTDALATYAKSQRTRAPRGALEADAALVRAAAFRPLDSRYDNDAARAQQDLPYVVVPSTIRVVRSDGTAETLDLVTPIAHCPKLLYFRGEELGVLGLIIDAMGGSPPSQGEAERWPGDSQEIAATLGRLFHTHRGHWGGWHLFAYPLIHAIGFEDAERTRAIAKYRVEYSGGEARLVREAKGWQLTKVDFQWIE